MNILIVSNYLPPKIGGIERISHELATSLQELENVNVTVACAKWPAKYISSAWKSIPFTYRVVYVPSITIGKRLPLPNLFSPNFWSSIRKLEKSYDFVFFQSHLFVLNWILLFKFRNIKRKIWMNQGCNYVPMKNTFGKFISYRYERIGIFFMARYANEFIGQSKNTAKWASRESGLPFRYLNNSISLESLRSNVVGSTSKIPSRVLFVGRLVEGKGLSDCINVVERANSILLTQGEDMPYNLTIAGSGDLEKLAMYERKNLKVEYLGELSHDGVIEQMYRADVLIQAYTQPEGVTTVTLEGLATGMLVVSTPLGGDGLLEGCANFVSGNIEDLPKLLVGLRNRVEDRKALTKIGLSYVEKNFSWKVNARKLIRGDFESI
jgi:glycosyltransferase involved in cell wall biosynthesis